MSDDIRAVLLEVLRDLEPRGPGYFQAGAILREAAGRLGIQRNRDKEQALLTLWGDLFRQGILAWGYDLNNLQAPFCHLTERGRRTLEHLSRDPANPDGYRAHLLATTQLNPIADSYVQEALNTYNSGCFKAAAVMVGVAAESLVLELRDAIVTRLERDQRQVRNKLRGWKAKEVLDALRAELANYAGDMPAPLRERVEAYWPALAHQLRTVRNEAGHPTSIEPVSQDSAHAGLLVFPELARLTRELIVWAKSDVQTG